MDTMGNPSMGGRVVRSIRSMCSLLLAAFLTVAQFFLFNARKAHRVVSTLIQLRLASALGVAR